MNDSEKKYLLGIGLFSGIAFAATKLLSKPKSKSKARRNPSGKNNSKKKMKISSFRTKLKNKVRNNNPDNSDLLFAMAEKPVSFFNNMISDAKFNKDNGKHIVLTYKQADNDYGYSSRQDGWGVRDGSDCDIGNPTSRNDAFEAILSCAEI